MKGTVNYLRKNGVSYARGGRSAGDIPAKVAGVRLNIEGTKSASVEDRGTIDNADG